MPQVSALWNLNVGDDDRRFEDVAAVGAHGVGPGVDFMKQFRPKLWEKPK
jgi:hypothetical protein